MSTVEPGTVAVATVRGVENVRVMARYGTAEPRLRWLTTDERLVDLTNDGWYFAHDVTDVRPLVVLDMAGIAPEAIVKALRDKDAGTNGTGWARVADQIAAQTKPSRIPEPGLWGVVEAGCKCDSERVGWVLHGTRWMDRCGDRHEWDDLIDPTLVREGVQS